MCLVKLFVSILLSLIIVFVLFFSYHFGEDEMNIYNSHVYGRRGRANVSVQTYASRWKAVACSSNANLQLTESMEQDPG